MVNFRVGDRVEVVNSGSSILRSGDIGTITLIESNVAKVHVNGKRNNGNWVRFESLKLIPTDNQRIEALEKRVEELEKLVADYFKLPVEPSTDDVEDKPKTPNQLRAEIIEKAKGFVIKTERNAINQRYRLKGDNYNRMLKAEYVINAQKLTIVVLLKGCTSGKFYGRGIAKCNPSDVFNEHIGKAIALGRALGLDVSEFEGAVQPTEVVVGMVFDSNWGPGFENQTCYHIDGDEIYNYSNKAGWFHKRDIKRIINDTKAVYESEVE